MGLFVDPAAVHADDALLDGLGSGGPGVDPVTIELAVWRAEVAGTPISVLRLPVFYGRHARSKWGALADWFRGVLVDLLPKLDTSDGERPHGALPAVVRRWEWRRVWTGLGDLLELLVGAASVVVCTVLGAGAALVLVAWAPVVVWLVLVLVGALALAVWRWRVASRRLEEITASLDDLLDGGEVR